MCISQRTLLPTKESWRHLWLSELSREMASRKGMNSVLSRQWPTSGFFLKQKDRESKENVNWHWDWCVLILLWYYPTVFYILLQLMSCLILPSFSAKMDQKYIHNDGNTEFMNGFWCYSIAKWLERNDMVPRAWWRLKSERRYFWIPLFYSWLCHSKSYST